MIEKTRFDNLPKIKRKRKAGSGKRKGSSFERSVCKHLSLWVTQGKREDVFWRSAMSGGRATVAKKAGRDVRQAGDICAVAPEGHKLTDKYYIECKFYRNLRITNFILDGEGKLARFWEEAVEQAKAHNREPILIAKENGREPIVLITPNNNLHKKVDTRWIQIHDDPILLPWDILIIAQFNDLFPLPKLKSTK